MLRLRLRPLAVVALASVLAACAGAQLPATRAPADSVRAAECASCAEWNAAHRPVRVFGNTYWVGTNGLGAILIHSPTGSVLIDGGLPESAEQIVANIRSLGFVVEDVRLILNSHAHFDHAGGIAALQRATGATVAASAPSAADLERGTGGRDDPQFGVLLPYPPATHVRRIADGETLHAGTVSVTAHFTPGHTPGGTTWSWRECEGSRCLDLVYADSQTPVSADGYFYSRGPGPTGAQQFERGFAVLERLRCDVLLTPHPSASRLWERIAARDSGRVNALVDPTACGRLAATGRAALAKRLATEAATK
jgi:metallo-beta-lactamase class B